MGVDIRILSPKATNQIFNFLEPSTLLRMRELGNTTKEIVDNLFIINQTQLDQFHIIETIEQDEITIVFYFKSIQHLFLGKIFAVSASTIIPDMHWSLTTANHGIRIILRSAYFQTFLIHYCSLLPSRLISFCDLSSDIIQTCSIHFDGALYECCYIEPNSIATNLEQWADLVHLLKPNFVGVSVLPRSQASFNFLLELADIVPKLNIVLERENEADNHAPLRLVQEILNRKCDMLLIDHIGMTETALSVSDVEKLIQFVHHLEKKKTVILWMSFDKRKMNIGEFRLKRYRRRDRRSEFMLVHLSEENVIV